MKNLKFLAQYIFKPRTVGAVLPSSKHLAKKMVASINFDAAKCIVEYGPGTGVFTELILEKCDPSTTVILFEMNEDFCNLLAKRFGTRQNVHIVNESAVNVGAKLTELGLQHADYIVSGLPFASLPQDITVNILTQTKKCLSPGGQFITFQYSLLKKGKIGKFFSQIEIVRELRNVPPAYVLRCSI